MSYSIKAVITIPELGVTGIFQPLMVTVLGVNCQMDRNIIRSGFPIHYYICLTVLGERVAAFLVKLTVLGE